MDSIIVFLSTIRWQDLIDIGLNSYILFRLYILFRGTNFLRVAISIALFWLVHWGSVYLELIVTSWAIQGLMAVTALIIIVVFNNEIKFVFRTKSLKDIFWGFSKKQINTPVEIIVKSVFEMGSKHCGALIVFPGKEDLQDVVKNGIRWEGIISKEMITTIFWHNNPVHDGAIIIEGNKVKEVSVILPLSQRTDLPSYYGTRHRAGIGLSDMTDALVIIVSEERGVILTVKCNNRAIMYKEEELQDVILKHLEINPEEYKQKKVSLRKKLLGPLVAALLSIIFVTGVWFGVTRRLNTLIAIEAPIEYMDKINDMEIISTSANNVRLHLSGSDVLVKSIKPEQIRVKINMSKASIGRNVFKITNDNVSLPPGIMLSKVEPSSIEIEVDAPITRLVPVQIDWAGRMPDHLILESAKISPDKVKLIGSSKILDNISTIYTEKVHLDKIEKNDKLTAKLLLPHANLQIAQDFSDKIKIEYLIKERTVDGNY